MNLLDRIKVGPHRISLRDYVRNVRHTICIRLYQTNCDHNWLYWQGGNGDPGYYHCPQCGLTRTD